MFVYKLQNSLYVWSLLLFNIYFYIQIFFNYLYIIILCLFLCLFVQLFCPCFKLYVYFCLPVNCSVHNIESNLKPESHSLYVNTYLASKADSDSSTVLKYNCKALVATLLDFFTWHSTLPLDFMLHRCI